MLTYYSFSTFRRKIRNVYWRIHHFTRITFYSINQYKHLHLINKNKIIKTQLSSKAILRDNSGVVYLTTGGTISFRQLQKFVVFEINRIRKAFAVISCLEATTEQLCKDSVTAAKLNNHIVLLKIHGIDIQMKS